MTTLALVLFSTAPSSAIDFAGMMARIEGDLEDRIDEIAALPGPTPAERKESRGLGRALAVLGAYEGGTGAKDLRVAAKALAAIYGTGTPDGDLDADVPAILACCDSLATGEQARATEMRSHLVTHGGTARVTAAIDRAEAFRARAAAEADQGRAARLYAKALAGFTKARESADRIFAKEVRSAPAFTCSFPQVPAFSATRASIEWFVFDVSLLVVVGRITGPPPEYGVALVIDVPPGPGTYALKTGSTRVWSGNMSWRCTAGNLVLDAWTESAVSGTFAFTTDGGFDVSDGIFRAPVLR